jgi:hypothetical protein
MLIMLTVDAAEDTAGWEETQADTGDRGRRERGGGGGETEEEDDTEVMGSRMMTV